MINYNTSRNKTPRVLDQNQMEKQFFNESRDGNINKCKQILESYEININSAMIRKL